MAGDRLVGAALGHHDVDHVRPVVGAALQDLPGRDRAADVQVGQVGRVIGGLAGVAGGAGDGAGVCVGGELGQPTLRGVPVREQVVDRAEGRHVAHPVTADEAGESRADGRTGALAGAGAGPGRPTAEDAEREASLDAGVDAGGSECHEVDIKSVRAETEILVFNAWHRVADTWLTCIFSRA